MKVKRDRKIKCMLCRDYIIDIVHNQHSMEHIPVVSWLSLCDLVEIKGLGIRMELDNQSRLWVIDSAGRLLISDGTEQYYQPYWIE